MTKAHMEPRAHPCPENDHGIGFQHYPHPRHHPAGDLKRWLAEFGSLGATWLCPLSCISELLPGLLIRALVEAEKVRLLDRMAVGVHRYAFNRPPLRGHGGRPRRPAARPDHCPPRSQDHVGFLLPRWYGELILQGVGPSLPLICTANGPCIGDGQYPNFPAGDGAADAQITVNMSQRLMAGGLPDYTFHNCLCLLVNGQGSPCEEHHSHWAGGRQLPAAQAMKEPS